VLQLVCKVCDQFSEDLVTGWERWNHGKVVRDLARQRWTEVRELLPIDVQSPFPQFLAVLPVRWSASQSMHYAAVSLLFQTSLNAPHLPLAQAKQPCGLSLSPVAFEAEAHDLKNVSLAFTHLDPSLPITLLGLKP
jgi:hypothetical protein